MRHPAFIALGSALLLAGCSASTDTTSIARAHAWQPAVYLPVVPTQRHDARVWIGGSGSNASSLSGMHDSLQIKTPAFDASAGLGYSPNRLIYAAGEMTSSGADAVLGGKWIPGDGTTVLLYGGVGLHYSRMSLTRVTVKEGLLTEKTDSSDYSYTGMATYERLGMTVTFRDGTRVRPYLALGWQINPALTDDSWEGSRRVDDLAFDAGASLRLTEHLGLQLDAGSVMAFGDAREQWLRGAGALTWTWGD